MSERLRVLEIVLIMAVLSMTVTGSTIWFLYRAAFNQQRAGLVESAQSEARQIEAIAREEVEHDGLDPGECRSEAGRGWGAGRGHDCIIAPAAAARGDVQRRSAPPVPHGGIGSRIEHMGRERVAQGVAGGALGVDPVQDG